ncbi:50S ribosomal protein L25/general stress protein Ctc [soil metagenome]
MSEPTLMAEPRSVVGKKVKRLRKEGKVPAVVYGPTLSETVQVTVNDREFAKFYHQHGHATLFDLKCDGQSWPVFIRDVQVDPVKWNPIHIDFFSPNLLKEIDASVPLNLHGIPEGGPGIFSQQLSELVVHGLPSHIPNRIVVDCSVLKEIGDAVRVGELGGIEDILIVTNSDEIIAMLAAPQLEVEEPEEIEEGAEADVAGEADAETSEEGAAE